MDTRPTVFYKIVCKDPEVKDCYVGQTSDLKERISCHKKRCNDGGKYGSSLVYRRIRETGGFENWEFVKLEEVICEPKEAYEIENFLYKVEGATLNTKIPNTFFGKSMSEYKKKYRKEHKEEVLEKWKEYRQINKSKIAQRSAEKIICDLCGKETTRNHISRHKKSSACIKKDASEKEEFTQKVPDQVKGCDG